MSAQAIGLGEDALKQQNIDLSVYKSFGYDVPSLVIHSATYRSKMIIIEAIKYPYQSHLRTINAFNSRSFRPIKHNQFIGQYSNTSPPHTREVKDYPGTPYLVYHDDRNLFIFNLKKGFTMRTKEFPYPHLILNFEFCTKSTLFVSTSCSSIFHYDLTAQQDADSFRELIKLQQRTIHQMKFDKKRSLLLVVVFVKETQSRHPEESELLIYKYSSPTGDLALLQTTQMQGYNINQFWRYNEDEGWFSTVHSCNSQFPWHETVGKGSIKNWSLKNSKAQLLKETKFEDALYPSFGTTSNFAVLVTDKLNNVNGSYTKSMAFFDESGKEFLVGVQSRLSSIKKFHSTDKVISLSNHLRGLDHFLGFYCGRMYAVHQRAVCKLQGNPVMDKFLRVIPQIPLQNTEAQVQSKNAFKNARSKCENLLLSFFVIFISVAFSYYVMGIGSAFF